MKTLIIYDANGTIYYMATGDYKTPSGLPYIECEVPDNKLVIGVNAKDKTVILADKPQTDIEAIRSDIENLSEVLDYLLMRED